MCMIGLGVILISPLLRRAAVFCLKDLVSKQSANFLSGWDFPMDYSDQGAMNTRFGDRPRSEAIRRRAYPTSSTICIDVFATEA